MSFCCRFVVVVVVVLSLLLLLLLLLFKLLLLSLNSWFRDLFLCSLNVILTVFAQGSLPPLQAYLTGRISTSGDVRQVVKKIFFDF